MHRACIYTPLSLLPLNALDVLLAMLPSASSSRSETQFVFEISPLSSPSSTSTLSAIGPSLGCSGRKSRARPRYCLEDQNLMQDMMGVFRVDPFAVKGGDPIKPMSESTLNGRHGPLRQEPTVHEFPIQLYDTNKSQVGVDPACSETSHKVASLPALGRCKSPPIAPQQQSLLPKSGPFRGCVAPVRDIAPQHRTINSLPPQRSSDRSISGSRSPQERQASPQLMLYPPPAVAPMERSLHHHHQLPLLSIPPSLTVQPSMAQQEIMYGGARFTRERSPPLRENLDQLFSDNNGTEELHSCPNTKVNECHICGKSFPRPSALTTHMNTHTGAKPYKCPIPSCDKSFAVRSNAKRHTRTHNVMPQYQSPRFNPTGRPRPSLTTTNLNNGSSTRSTASPTSTFALSAASSPNHTPPPSPGSVSISPPAFTQCALGIHPDEVSLSPISYMPLSLVSRTNARRLRSSPPFDNMFEDKANQGDLPFPLPPIVPSSYVLPQPTFRTLNNGAEQRLNNDNFDEEERDSYNVAPEWPYFPVEWRGLPGPKPHSPYRLQQPQPIRQAT